MTQSSRPLLGFWLCVSPVTPLTCSASKCVPRCGPFSSSTVAMRPTSTLPSPTKGVGPAIIRHVTLKVDGQPVRNWIEVLDKLTGPGKHRYSESDINGHVFAAGESMTVFTPQDADGNAITFDKSN